jgi:hypothetical protein
LFAFEVDLMEASKMLRLLEGVARYWSWWRGQQQLVMDLLRSDESVAGVVILYRQKYFLSWTF